MRAREDGRKQRYKKDLRSMDPETQPYWEEVLRRAGMYEEEKRSIGAGQNHKEMHWGTPQVTADAAQRLDMEQSSGRVKPKPTLGAIDNTYTRRKTRKELKEQQLYMEDRGR